MAWRNYKPKVPLVVNTEELGSAAELGSKVLSVTLQNQLNEAFDKEAENAYQAGYEEGWARGDNGFRRGAWGFFLIGIPIAAFIAFLCIFFSGRIAEGDRMTKEEYQACQEGNQSLCSRGINRLGGADASSMRSIFLNATGKDINASGVQVSVDGSDSKEYTVTLPEGPKVVITPK